MTDGSSFKRKNANKYYPDGVPGGEDYTEKRVNRTDKYTKDGKVIAEKGANVGRSAKAKKFDKLYTAIGAGERTSKKFATIRMSDGSSFKRKNANKYYPDGVPGGEDYTEKRVNRTDKYGADARKKVFAKGGSMKKDPTIVRTQFEEEEFEYANGGNAGSFSYSIGGL
jgi:hypothetical protein